MYASERILPPGRIFFCPVARQVLRVNRSRKRVQFRAVRVSPPVARVKILPALFNSDALNPYSDRFTPYSDAPNLYSDRQFPYSDAFNRYSDQPKAYSDALNLYSDGAKHD